MKDRRRHSCKLKVLLNPKKNHLSKKWGVQTKPICKEDLLLITLLNNALGCKNIFRGLTSI